MEVVNTTDVTPAEAVEFLIESGGLEKIMGPDACACFVVSRPINTPDFFGRLIENAGSIDSTTRQQVAFVVFYGESTIYARASSYHEPYQLTEAKLHDVSFSHHFDPRFDQTYADLFRRSPDSIDRRRFADHMTRATDALMDRFHLREASLPCVVFVDPKNTRTRLIVSLAGADPVSTLYSRVLSPLSDAFRDLQKWLQCQKERDHLSWEEAKRDQALEFCRTANEREAVLRNESIAAEKAIASFSNPDLPKATGTKLESARAEFARIDLEIDSLQKEIETEGDSPARNLALVRLNKRRRKSQQRMDAFRGDTFLKQLRNEFKAATSRLDEFLQQKADNEAALRKIPDDIADFAHMAKDALDKHTRNSAELGYDWPTVCSNWRRDWTMWSRPLGPRAFGVVEHVLSRVAKITPDTIGHVGQDIEYDVALSFAGEDRQVAETIATLLTKNGVRVFYDRDEEVDLWGRDLYQHLANVYGNKAHFCVMFLSASYAAKRWTSHELRHAQARAFRENREYILPIRLDSTDIPGIPETVGFMDLREVTPERVVAAVVAKLGLLASRETA